MCAHPPTARECGGQKTNTEEGQRAGFGDLTDVGDAERQIVDGVAGREVGAFGPDRA